MLRVEGDAGGGEEDFEEVVGDFVVETGVEVVGGG